MGGARDGLRAADDANGATTQKVHGSLADPRGSVDEIMDRRVTVKQRGCVTGGVLGSMTGLSH